MSRTFLVATTVLAATSFLVADPIPYTLFVDSGVLSRTLEIREGRLRTVSIVNRTDGGSLLPEPGSAEFSLTLIDGSSLKSADYRVVRCEVDREGDATTTIVSLQSKAADAPKVVVEYAAKKGDHFLRKRIRCSGGAVVQDVEVESFHAGRTADVGGCGQPFLLDGRWFFGLEHPAGQQVRREGRVVCRHHPGRASPTSPWAVFGAVGVRHGNIHDEFERYLATIRRPSAPMLQYNTWYDRRGSDVAPETLKRTYDAFRQKLLDPFKLKFDAFVVDDGYQDPKSLWACNQRWPEGLHGLARGLEADGSRLGLWVPLSGVLFDGDWGASKGYERTDNRKRPYCLCGECFNNAAREALRERIRDGRLAYLKHDFNLFECAAAGHGHLASSAHGREANVDAQMNLLAFEREVQTDLKVGLTTGVWPSPWWLIQADYLWMGWADHDHDWRIPVWSSREAEATFRDARLYRLLRIDRAQVPLAAVMTHGLIRGRYAGIDPKETLRDWSDYVMLFFGRGTMLHELYLTPETTPDDYWPVLGHAIRWARANAEVLSHSRMIGGRPDHGDPYGFVHWSASKGIFCLRNPSDQTCEFPLSLDQRPAHLPQVAQWTPFVVYPDRRRLPAFGSGNAGAVRLPAHSVTIVEAWLDVPGALRTVAEGAFDVRKSESGLSLVEFTAPRPVDVSLEECFPDRTDWRGRIHAAPDDDVVSAELRVAVRPSRGLKLAAKGAAFQRRSSPEPIPEESWGLERAGLRPDALSGLEVHASVPPSPFYPQSANFRASLRIVKRLTPRSGEAPITEADAPAWPLAPDAGLFIQDAALDDWTVNRSRSRVELVLWAALLGALPIAVVLVVSDRLGRGRSARLHLARAIGLALVLAFYAITPVGGALGSVLRELKP